VSDAGELLEDTAEELFESAPCGYVTTRLDGTIVRVNRTFEDWTGFARDALVGRRRFQDLLTAGGRIYHETHYAPLLHMQGAVREIALDVVRADGKRLPALVNSVVRGEGTAARVRTTVFDATDRRRYEQELVRARRREQDIALELQRSLLSGAMPDDDRVRIDVVYRPAVSGLEVGGDWYDAFWLEEGASICVVVGDVVGRGITAAATMGQLRSGLRALASTGLGPGAALAALDAYARRHDVGQMATVVLAEIELDERRVRWACAGHPPPAVVEPGREARLLWDGRSPPIDAFGSSAGAGRRAEGELVLAPGGALVLYSDGLVERRDRTLRAGFEELVAALESVRTGPAARLAEGVTRELVPLGPRTDDVCVVAVTLPAPVAA
jgi:PAS domain S-box-containing protein